MITYNCDACERKIEGKPFQISVMVTPIEAELHTREIARAVFELCKPCNDGLVERPSETCRFQRVVQICFNVQRRPDRAAERKDGPA